MARLDLHLHSTESDGVRSPAWVVQSAAENGAELIALTDHDTLAGVAEARREAEHHDIRIIAGVELGVSDPELGELHVLGYFGSEAPLEELDAQLAAYRAERETRAEHMLARLESLGLPVNRERLATLAAGDAVGRPHIARALVEAGHVRSVQDAFDRYLHNGGPAFIPRTLLGLSESVAMIHNAGGIASLAHPSRYVHSEGAAQAFAAARGDGLEAYYRRDSRDLIAKHVRLARQLGLTPTVGSDFHGLHQNETMPATVEMPDPAADALSQLLGDLA